MIINPISEMLRHLILNRLLVLFLFLACCGGATKAQIVLTMSFDSLTTFPDPDTASFQDTVTYRFSVFNQSLVDFNDSLIFNISTPLGTFLLEGPDTVHIPPQTSRSFALIDTVTALRYGGGVNIVVVWPTSPTPILTDSISDTLFVQDPQFFDDTLDANSMLIFPNPTSGMLYLQPGSPLHRVRKATLIDTFGRVILQEEGLPRSMDFSKYATGIYFLRLTMETGKNVVYRIARQ